MYYKQFGRKVCFFDANGKQFAHCIFAKKEHADRWVHANKG